ncbi:MAG: ABC transporter permease [Propionibacteriaceae bacterium]|nr:ABC transporter permease [Micropruina sp.]HBX81978.1 ABC transporter permease [Propionibacteriaceae bacterium]HBY23867.1 ABC transporter permease [Propionibacteriaceae bacterium]
MSLKRIRLVMWKEFLQLRRDPLLLRAMFLMPILQLVFFGYVVAADVKNISIAVIDLDHSVASRQLEAEFASSDYFVITQHPATEAELQPLMDKGAVKAALVIPDGTSAALTRGEAAPIGVVVDGSESSSASIASGYAAQIVGEFNQRQIAASGMTIAAPGIDARIRVVFNPTLESINSMIPGLIAALLMISFGALMSQAVVKERESGTLEQMFVTPIKRNEYLIGKLTPYVVLAIAQVAVVAIIGMLWFKVPFYGSWWVVAVGLGLFLLTSVGLGLLISLVSHTRQQAQQTVMFLMIPQMVLSGFIFPVESMPAWIAPIANVIPLTHALVVLRGAFVKGSGFAALATPLWILAAFAVVIFGAAVVQMQRRLAE